MDAVKSFNNELSSLYDVKPPISKAKMTALTRGAIKAIKFYKHVVQSVEKFILKCKPEYKVPGLYVIDSIVRQSRHQFGTDKDVFAPRFAKNIQQTFINLFRCPPEDKSKVIRVLNLWQKNQVFAPEVIQPLFDLADPNHPIHREQAALASNGLAGQNLLNKSSPANQKTPTKKSDGNLWQNTTQLDATNALAHLGVASLAANPNALLQLSGQSMDPSMLVQLQALQRLLLKQSTDTSGSKSDGGQVHFDRKLLDFDYGSDEEDDHANPSPKAAPASSGIDTVGSLLANPEVMRQLQTLQQQLSQQQQIEMEEKLRKLQEMKQQEEEFDKHLAQTVPNLPFAAECDLKPVSHTNSPANLYKHEPAYVLPSNFDLSQPPPGYKMYGDQAGSQDDTLESEVEFIDNHDNGEVINLDHSDSRSPSPDDRYSRRRRSRSRDRSRGRDRDRDRRSRRSRSRSRSRSRRRRSRSRERERDREKDKEKEKDREKDRERRKRGLPPIKKENLSVCSTTLWVGHLSKLVHQEDLSDTFGEFGDIVSIDLIPPRGCAFIVMNRRQDAARCLSKLKNHKMQGKAITLAWAPGKGVKGKDFKDYWEVELGVSYIPWSKIKPDTDIELLEEGGMIDEDTMPEWLRAKQAETQPKPIMKPAVLDPNESSMLEKPGFIPLPDGTPVASTGTPTTGVDTSQPPPLHANNLLPPPMAMPIVSPFSLNTRLLGPMGHMSLPPGMMPNVPIGVPPPNLPGGPLLPNQLLGIGSPFGQGMPGMPQMSQMPMAANQENKAGPGLLPPGVPNVTENIPESVMGVPPHSFTAISMGSHNDDNMDIEMEDAEKPEKQMPLSDQLLASIGGGGFNNPPNNSTPNLGIAAGRFGGNIPPLMPPTDIDERHGPSNRDSRDNRDSRTRDRNDRDRDRDRDRSRRSSRDRGRDRDLGRNDRRERNRWSDRDRRDRDRNDRDDKKSEQPPPRNEKSLAERLREMAHEGVVPNRDRPPRDRNDDQHQSFEPPIDRSGFPTFPNGEPHHPERMDRNRTERDRMDHDRHDHGRGDRARLDNERMERDHERTDMGWRDRRGQDMFRDGSHVAPPGVPHAGPPRAGPPSGPRVGPPSGPPNVPPGGPPVVPHGGPPGGPPGGPHGGPPSVPHGGPPGGAHGGPPPAPHGGPPGGPHSGPPGGPPNGPHGGPPGGSHGGHPGGPHGGHQAGIHGGLPIVLHGGPPGGPHGPPSGPHGPPSGHHSGPPGGHHGPPSGHHGGPPGVPPGEHSDDFHGEEFKPRMRRHPDEFPMDHSEHDPRIPHHGDFDPRIANPDMEHRRPPMMHHDEIPPGMEHERFEFGMRGGRDGSDRRDFGRRGPDDMRMMDEYDHRMRGPDFHPREGFGPRMRGPGPDGFPPRPLLGRPPGPHMFHARGPPMRGPRPGPWMENIRPNFPPRFEGPGPDFHNRMPFDEHHPRHRRYDDRRRFRSEDNPPEHERFDRRSRWSNNSPNKTEEMIPADCTSTEATDEKEIFKESNKDVLQVKDDNMKTDMKVSKEMETKPRVGGTTPLRDEPQDTHATEPHVQNDAPPPPGTETKEETETKESVAAEETA